MGVMPTRGAQPLGFKKIQALLQDQLVQLKIGHNLLQPLVLTLKRLQFRKLGLAHAPELLAPGVIGCIADTHRAAGRAPSDPPERWTSISRKSRRQSSSE